MSLQHRRDKRSNKEFQRDISKYTALENQYINKIARTIQRTSDLVVDISTSDIECRDGLSKKKIKSFKNDFEINYLDKDGNIKDTIYCELQCASSLSKMHIDPYDLSTFTVKVSKIKRMNCDNCKFMFYMNDYYIEVLGQDMFAAMTDYPERVCIFKKFSPNDLVLKLNKKEIHHLLDSKIFKIIYYDS